jgi:hypothetical protein
MKIRMRSAACAAALSAGANAAVGLGFLDGRDGDVGALLDDVSISSAVPEPAGGALRAAGVLGVACAARRRRG